MTETALHAPSGLTQPDLATQSDPNAAHRPEREMKPALLCGWKRRCPSCGNGPLLKGYLKVRDECPVCGEAFHYHRADDGPPYLTILVVGHLMAPLMGWIYMDFRPDPLVMATGFITGTVALSLYLLPRFKGMIVAFQWAKRMGGFDQPTS
jgi:uncharacterized protein (DUF983 family)